MFLALGILPYFPSSYLNPSVLTAFAIISFVLTLLISAYHLSTMLRRRKRKTDRLQDEQKASRQA
jgi:membrane protein implicated in regulation of membrane protease activity